jgi:negative regulator of sigma E activity
VQRLWERHAISNSTCEFSTEIQDTARVPFMPVAGLWVIYGATVGLAAVVAAAVLLYRRARQPEKSAAAMERARALSMQITSTMSRSLSHASRLSGLASYRMRSSRRLRRSGSLSSDSGAVPRARRVAV